MALFIHDFDLTITSEHLHNIITTALNNGTVKKWDYEAHWALVKHVKPRGTTNQWKMTLEQIQQDGHQNAIASFNSYPYIIQRYLREIIDISTNIPVFSWLPEKGNQQSKKQHIDAACDFFNRPDEVVLIDDDLQNVIAAMNNNIEAIHAEENTTDWFATILAVSHELRMNSDLIQEVCFPKVDADLSQSDDVDDFYFNRCSL